MEKQFNKYLNGTANPDEFSEVLNALCSKDNNKKITAEILKLWKDTLKAAIDNKENSQLLDKIHHRIALEESKSIARRFTLYRNLLKVAAILITGLIISTLFLYTKPEKQYNLATIETVTTPYGARTSFKLPDGSEVWMNSGSTISFPKQYEQTRYVKLTGEAYFKVLKDGKPFIVKTNLGTIEVMGTSFDVRAFNDDNFTTTLVEGSVIVRSITNQLATLKPGQQSVITSTNELSMKDVNTELSTSWRDGKLIFVKEPFANVAKALERWYNVKIELQGERLKKLGYTGTIEMETFGEVLELINTTTPIKYKFDKNTRILMISGR
jgi:ferric-dicitrate binding protein FerR (iron transport regulator)